MLDRDELITWLKSLDPNEFVTRKCGKSACPLEAFLYATKYDENAVVVCVAHSEIVVYPLGGYEGDIERYPTPQWAHDFICGIDKLAKKIGGWLIITVRHCLEQLEKDGDNP